jgi:hypothetical protein
VPCSISAFGRAVIRFGVNRILEWTATATAYARRTPDWPSQMYFGGNKRKKAIRIATCDVSATVSDIGALFILCAPLMTPVRNIWRNCRAGWKRVCIHFTWAGKGFAVKNCSSSACPEMDGPKAQPGSRLWRQIEAVGYGTRTLVVLRGPLKAETFIQPPSRLHKNAGIEINRRYF